MIDFLPYCCIDALVPTRSLPRDPIPDCVGIQFAARAGVRSILILAAVLICFANWSYADGHNATLSWNSLGSPAVAGYNVYFGTTAGQYPYKINVGSATTFTVSNLTAGITYYFAATSIDTNGVESTFSSPVSYLVPGVVTMSPAENPGDSPLIQFPVEPDHWYELQATTDFQTWTSILQTSVVSSNAWMQFTDTNAAGFSSRFYRLVLH